LREQAKLKDVELETDIAAGKLRSDLDLLRDWNVTSTAEFAEKRA
jgi:hypothetical protein